MRLNKKGKPYIEPNPPQKCRIVNSDGLIFKAAKAPEGFCRCGIMLELMPSTKDYIFPTTKSAIHAIAHTVEYMKSLGVILSPKDFFVEKIK